MKKVNYFQREPFNAVLKAVMLQNFYAIDDLLMRLQKIMAFHKILCYQENDAFCYDKIVVSLREQ